MSSFSKAMRSLPPEARPIVRARLLEWSKKTRIGRVVAANLDSRERFLPTEAMAKLLSAIARRSSGDLDQIARAYEVACHKQVRLGGPVKLRDLPPLLGRAVERDRLRAHLLRHCDYFGGVEEEVEGFIEKLILGIPLEGI